MDLKRVVSGGHNIDRGIKDLLRERGVRKQ